MDSFGDHALVCSCKGDRTRRHNAVRDLVYEDASEARMNPEREKAGLLPSRPADDGIHADSGDENRRPADVWLPGGAGSSLGRAEALDFALTSGLRSDRLDRSATDANEVLALYEDFKASYKDTKAKCEQERFVFTPIVFESHGGGFSKTALRILNHIANQQVAAGLQIRQGASTRIAQRVSTAIHMANARAVLKRLIRNGGEPNHTYDMEAADAATHLDMA